VGRIAACLAPLVPLSIHNAGGVASILIIRPGGIGDAVLLVPAIHRLREKYPGAKITVLAERRNAAVFALSPQIDRVLHYDIPAELLTALRGTYDLVIDSEQWHRLSAVVARLCRPKMLIGFGTNERLRIFSHAVAYSHDDYEATSFLRLVEPLGIAGEDLNVPFLTVPEAAMGAVDDLLTPLTGRPFVAIFPGASIPERRWGADRYRQVAESLNAAGYPVVVVGGRDDRDQGDEIVAGVEELNLAGRTSLAETAAILGRSRLLVCGDSGLLHMAIGLGIRTVSLFGPGRALKWAPRGRGHVVINRGLPCSPCTTFGTTPPCSIQARCMREITVEQVLEGVTGLLSRTERG
jgi:lipopolysaccharide heptosyltransferase II